MDLCVGWVLDSLLFLLPCTRTSGLVGRAWQGGK